MVWLHRLGINRVGHKNLSIRCLRVKETRIARIVFSIGLQDEIATKRGSRIEMLMWVLVLFMILMNYMWNITKHFIFWIYSTFVYQISKNLISKIIIKDLIRFKDSAVRKGKKLNPCHCYSVVPNRCPYLRLIAWPVPVPNLCRASCCFAWEKIRYFFRLERFPRHRRRSKSEPFCDLFRNATERIHLPLPAMNFLWYWPGWVGQGYWSLSSLVERGEIASTANCSSSSPQLLTRPGIPRSI